MDAQQAHEEGGLDGESLAGVSFETTANSLGFRTTCVSTADVNNESQVVSTDRTPS